MVAVSWRLTLALSRGPAYSRRVAEPPFINVEENVDRIVGKRTKAPDGLSTVTSYRAESVAWSKSFGGVRVPRGVYRFRTHEESDEWLWRMIARPRT